MTTTEESYASVIKSKYKEQAQMSNMQPASMGMMSNPYSMQMNMMNMMYMNMGMPMMQNQYQQMMMMNMMQNMGINMNMNMSRSNMFVRRAKDNKKGNKKRPMNRRRRGQGSYNKGFNKGNAAGYKETKPAPPTYGPKVVIERQVKATPQQQNQPRVRLDSDSFPSLPRREINVNEINVDIEVAAPGTLSGNP